MIRLKEYMAEFITLYDDNGKEIVTFQSDQIEGLEKSICSLLDHLGIDYENKDKGGY